MPWTHFPCLCDDGGGGDDEGGDGDSDDDDGEGDNGDDFYHYCYYQLVGTWQLDPSTVIS